VAWWKDEVKAPPEPAQRRAQLGETQAHEKARHAMSEEQADLEAKREAEATGGHPAHTFDEDRPDAPLRTDPVPAGIVGELADYAAEPQPGLGLPEHARPGVPISPAPSWISRSVAIVAGQKPRRILGADQQRRSLSIGAMDFSGAGYVVCLGPDREAVEAAALDPSSTSAIGQCWIINTAGPFQLDTTAEVWAVVISGTAGVVTLAATIDPRICEKGSLGS